MSSHAAPGVAPWTTLVGARSAREIERLCGEREVPFDRARRTYWQREGLYPLAAARAGYPKHHGRFHDGSVDLATFVHECLSRGLPERPSGARSSLVPLRALLAAWWAEEMDGGLTPEGEARFYERVRGAVQRVVATAARARGHTPERPAAGAVVVLTR